MSKKLIPSWRVTTWMLLIFNVLMLIWMISAANAGAKACVDESADTRQACETGAAIGTTLGAGIVAGFWAAGDIVLGLTWLITRSRFRDCPACGHRVKKGETICRSCGHNFAAGGVVAAGTTRPCPACQQQIPRAVDRCPLCGTASSPWVFHEGRWWGTGPDGARYWLNELDQRWVKYEEPTVRE